MTDMVMARVCGELTDALAAREHQLAAAEANLTSLRATLSEREKELARLRTVNGRIVIVCDGNRWYIRRLRVIEHDLDLDEKVYRCDQPLGNDFATLLDAVCALFPSQESSLGCGCVDACRQGFNFAMCHLRAENRHRPETIPGETK